MDRVMLAAGCGENQFHHKVGAALCTLRRSGGMETYQQLLGQKEKKLPKVSRKPAPVIPKKIPRDNPKSRERLIKELQIEAEKAAEEEARQEAERLKKEEEKREGKSSLSI